MKIRPLNDNLLVSRIKEQEKVGSFFIPDAAKDKSDRAKVLACGPGKLAKDGKRLPMNVRAGQTVLLASKYAGHEFELSGEKAMIVSEDDVLGVEE